MVDYDALLQLLIHWGLIGLLFYTVGFLALKCSNLFRATECPSCGFKIKRSKSKSKEHWMNFFSLGMLKFKRYRCYKCYWEGTLRETRRPKKRPVKTMTEH